MPALLFTPIASPFLEQPYTLLATMDPPITVVPVFYGDASERSTWGKLTWQGHQLSGSLLQRVKQINRIFDDVKPDRVFLSQYLGWVTWFARAKALRRGIPFYFFFLDAFCPRGHLRSALREFLFKKTVHKSGGIGVMGKTTHQICGRLYPGPIIDTPYCFDVSEMLTFDDSLRSADKTVSLPTTRAKYALLLQDKTSPQRHQPQKKCDKNNLYPLMSFSDPSLCCPHTKITLWVYSGPKGIIA